MTQESSPQSKNGKTARSSSLQGTTLNGKTAAAQSPVQQLISTGQSQQSTSPKQAQLNKSSPKQQTKHPQEWSLKVKATALALAVSILPVLGVGTASYLGSQSLQKQVSEARLVGGTEIAETEIALQRQLMLIALGTGATAVLAGVIAAFLVNRAMRSVLNAAVDSTTVVNRLRREDVNTRDRVAGKDELVALLSV